MLRPAMLEPEFVADCPYAPGGLLIDAVLSVEPAVGRVVVRMPTHDELPLTREQRAHPVRHPQHVAGGLMVHMTGMAGFVHAYYVLGLRHRDGWIGYGGAIHKARFKALAELGKPIVIECVATQVRRGPAKILARYQFVFRQGETVVYEGDQTALWLRVTAEEPAHPRADAVAAE